MRSRPLLGLLVVLFCSAFQSTGFQGCGGSAPPAADLPPSTFTGCFVDEDCPPDPCTMVACVSGECVSMGILDADGDGVSPLPCGMDCDDFDGALYPGAMEYCDGRDQDCDGNIDEDATPTARSWTLTSFDDQLSVASMVTPSGEHDLLVAQAISGGGLELRRVTLEGTTFTESGLMIGAVTSYDAVSRPDGTVTVFAIEPGMTTLRVVTVNATLSVTDDVPVTISADATGIAAEPYGAEVAAVWLEGGSNVRFWTSQMTDPVTVTTTTESGNVELAFNGASMVVAVPPDRAFFLDPATGMTITSRMLDAPRTWATGPLASSSGTVIALIRDAFDHTITRFNEASPLGRTPAPAVMDRTTLGRVDVGGGRVIVTRFSNGTTSTSGVSLSILSTDFVVESDFPVNVLGSLGGLADGWEVVAETDSIVVVTNFSSSGQLYGTTLTCGL